MAPTQQLFRHTYGGRDVSMIASGAIVANLCVAIDTATDTTGATCKAVAALANKIAGVVDQAYATGDFVKVIREAGMIVPMTCIDASIAVGIPVYNDATGKVTATNGASSTLIGTTKGKTTAANQLVPVALAAF